MEDVHWLLATDSGSLVVPQEAEGMQELLARLQRLPGFDNNAVIEAMVCTEDRIFPVWKIEGNEKAAMPASGLNS